MRFLVRFMTRVDDGATEKRDKVFAGSTLTLGRGTDQTLHIRDPRTALEHAVIVSRDGRFFIRALTLSGVIVNDALTRETVIVADDRIRVGDNVLTVIAPPAGFDFALTFELDTAARALDAAPPSYRTRLNETGLQSRRWAWLAAVLILLVTLVLPALVFLNDGTARVLRDTPLPDDGVWLSGPLHPAHRFIGDDCTACHDAFKMTPNAKCMTCHNDVQRHIPVNSPSSSDEMSVALSQRRCGACHKEHNEPPALVRQDEAICGDCHGKIETDTVTTLRNVSNFDNDHPGFRVSLLSPPEQPDSTQWTVKRVDLKDPALKDRSRLIFPHSKHLDPAGIKGTDGDVVLVCADCHLPQGGGAIMRAVEMTRDCQGCHRLDFEPAEPAREVRHAPTSAVLAELQEYYAWRYLYGLEDTSALGLDPGVFRRPGRIDDRAARAALDQAAREKARAALADLERRACANCHVIDQVVLPVRLTGHWLPKSRFDHREHRLFDCEACHAARDSEVSTDVLIPDIDTCQQCHAGSMTQNKIVSSCVACHGFHTPEAGSWLH